MKFICKLVGHRRSKKGARRRGDEWLSRCAFCGEPMIRVFPGDWEIGNHELKPGD